MRLSNVAERAEVFVLLSVLATTSVHAADPLNGRWAADPSHCAGAGNTRAQSPLIITDSAVRWSGDACRIGRVYRAGDTVHIEAFCSGRKPRAGDRGDVALARRPACGHLGPRRASRHAAMPERMTRNG